MIAPLLIVHEPDVLPAVRELLSNSPEAAHSEEESIAKLLYARRFLPYRPTVFAVEAALEALVDNGRVLA